MFFHGREVKGLRVQSKSELAGSNDGGSIPELQLSQEQEHRQAVLKVLGLHTIAQLAFVRNQRHVRFAPENKSDISALANNEAAIAVPTGVMSSDDSTIHYETRTAARGYMKRKLIKFGIKMCVNVVWNLGHLHSTSDNYSGNATGISPAILHCFTLQYLLGVMKRQLYINLVAEDCASALWAL